MTDTPPLKVRRISRAPTILCDTPKCPTDNSMQTKAEIASFFKALVEIVIVPTNPSVLAEMAMVMGPTFWLLCVKFHAEFARLYHLGKYSTHATDSLWMRVNRTAALRSVYFAFRSAWACKRQEGIFSTAIQWKGANGELFTPDDWNPSYEHRTKGNKHEYQLEWWNRGRLTRKVYDSQGRVVNERLGYPCSVISRDHVVETEISYNAETDQVQEVQVHGTWLQLKYEIRENADNNDGYITIALYPDSDVELRNFIESGYRAAHPLVARNFPYCLRTIYNCY